jgi:hypothetical protein
MMTLITEVEAHVSEILREKGLLCARDVCLFCTGAIFYLPLIIVTGGKIRLRRLNRW